MGVEERSPLRMSPPTRRIRHLSLTLCFIAALYLFLGYQRPPLTQQWSAMNLNQYVGSLSPEQAALQITNHELVPLEAHIMSKCPDAEDCLRMMVLPAMQRVVDKVNFTLSFIGTNTVNDGVQCKHGPPECLGNIIELCSAYLYPDPKIYLGFTMCLTRDFSHIPEQSLVEDCALEHGIDFGKLNECASSEDGLGLGMLRDSVKRTSEAGVTKSCTVRLNEEIYCIRDNGEWKDCPNGAGVNDLVIAVEKLWRSS